MDMDNIVQNMNTRVVFKETRGMVRWLQLIFAIIAFSSVTNFETSIDVNIVGCAETTTVAPPSGVTPVVPPAAPVIANLKYNVKYPFDLPDVLTSPCLNVTYKAPDKLSSSPQFFVATGVLAMLLSFTAIITYLLFTHTYTSIPMLPMADLFGTALICLFWFTASCAFASGVSQLKITLTHDALQQVICQTAISCTVSEPVWKGLNVALVTGFTSFLLWSYGIWTVYKETQFHAPRDQFPHQTLS